MFFVFFLIQNLQSQNFFALLPSLVSDMIERKKKVFLFIYLYIFLFINLTIVLMS